MREELLVAFKVLGIKPPEKPTNESLLKHLSNETGIEKQRLKNIFSKPNINIDLLSDVRIRDATEDDIKELARFEQHHFYDVPLDASPDRAKLEESKMDFSSFIKTKTKGVLIIEGKEKNMLGQINFYNNILDSLATHKEFRSSTGKERNLLGTLLVLKAMQKMKNKHDRVKTNALGPGADRLFETLGFKKRPDTGRRIAREYTFRKLK